MQKVVLIKGGGDVATGIAHRLFRSGFTVVITEIAQPTVIRRTVAFAEAVYSGECTVEGVTAVVCSAEHWEKVALRHQIPVIIDPAAVCAEVIKPWAVVDAIIAKKNTGTFLTAAPLVIGVGPGFTAGQDVHAVVETMRGHDLGRVYVKGAAQPDTGIPGEIGGFTRERLLRSPATGIFQTESHIGEHVEAGQIVAWVEGEPIYANIRGIIRGLLQDGLSVNVGLKVGDIDPRCKSEHCFSISDKARSVGGGVLEALLWLGRDQQ